MPQINIKCPKCHRFVKSIACKLVSQHNLRCIGKCTKCKIKIFNSMTGTIKKWDGEHTYKGILIATIKEQIDEKTFKKYFTQFQPKQARETIKDRIYKFLNQKKIAVTRKQIQEKLNLKENSVSKAIRLLRKERKIKLGFLAPYRYGYGKRKKYVMLKNVETKE